MDFLRCHQFLLDDTQEAARTIHIGIKIVQKQFEQGLNKIKVLLASARYYAILLRVSFQDGRLCPACMVSEVEGMVGPRTRKSHSSIAWSDPENVRAGLLHQPRL